MQEFFHFSVIFFASLVAPDPTYETKIELAKVYYYQKKYKEALDVINLMGPHKPTFEEEFLLADIYLAQKDYDKAEELYRKLVTQNPEKKDLLLLRLAEMLSWQKRYDESLQIYQDLVERNQDDIQLRRKYAQVLLWSGNIEKATQELEKSLDKK